MDSAATPDTASSAPVVAEVAPPPPAGASAPPPPLPPFPTVAAPSDIYPRTPRERELCAAASKTDWLYLGVGLVLVPAGITYDLNVKVDPSEAVRLSGPAAVGLTWGFLVGGLYLSLPKCSPQWVDTAPAEGSRRSPLPIALSFAALAAFTAPLMMGIEQGGPPPSWIHGWGQGERQLRVVFASATGAAGAFLPYLLPPKTWSAAKKLETIRAEPYQGGVMLRYIATF